MLPPHAPQHDHASSGGDDHATNRMPAPSDARAETTPAIQPDALEGDALPPGTPPADARTMPGDPRLAADITHAPLERPALDGRHPSDAAAPSPPSASPQARLREREEGQAAALALARALIAACEAYQAPHHSAAPTPESDPPAQRSPTAKHD